MPSHLSPGALIPALYAPKKNHFATESPWIFQNFDRAILLSLLQEELKFPSVGVLGSETKGILKPSMTHPESP